MTFPTNPALDRRLQGKATAAPPLGISSDQQCLAQSLINLWWREMWNGTETPNDPANDLSVSVHFFLGSILHTSLEWVVKCPPNHFISPLQTWDKNSPGADGLTPLAVPPFLRLFLQRSLCCVSHSAAPAVPRRPHASVPPPAPSRAGPPWRLSPTCSSYTSRLRSGTTSLRILSCSSPFPLPPFPGLE